MRSSGSFILLYTDFGLQVRYDGYHLVEVTAPSSYAGRLCGMCGEFPGHMQVELGPRATRASRGLAHPHGNRCLVEGVVCEGGREGKLKMKEEKRLLLERGWPLGPGTEPAASLTARPPGNYNNNSLDDDLQPDKRPAVSSARLGASWKLNELSESG